MLKRILFSFSLCALVAHSAVNYPYPQRKNYGNSTINAVNSTADADLKARFKAFLNNFYIEGKCGGADCARIKFDEPENTVSEGIGYAMIMMVYFSDATTSYQTHFDKLWKYYQNFKNNNGFMHWKIGGFSGAVEQNGATDAELDVALALIMAYYQFGDAKYQTDATALINKIWQYEMNSDGLHKPGDNWDNDKNPSYVAPAAFELFKDLGNSANWTTALSRNYTFLKANQNSSTAGLPSDWANADGSPKKCTYCGYGPSDGKQYGQDAVRAPWRWATAKAWFGHADAGTLLSKLGTWVNGKNPGEIKGPIKLDGTMGTVANASYLGSLMCALMDKSAYQNKLNSYWASWATITGDTYFNSAMQILTGLLVSGNMPNLKACKAGNCGTDMTKPGDYEGAYTQLDKLAFAGSENIDARSYAVTGEPWFAYTDSKAGYGTDGKPANGQAQSTITNEKFKGPDENDNCKEAESYRVILSSTGSTTAGTDWSVQIKSYTLKQGTYKYDPFVAIGLDAKNNGKATSAGGYDISKCTGGFSYEYKGSAHKFKVLNKNIGPTVGSDHLKKIGESKSVAANWTSVVVPPGELAQPDWVSEGDQITFRLEDVRGWEWMLAGDYKNGSDIDIAGHSPMTGSLSIRNFRCLGDMPLPPARGATACGTDIGGGGTPTSSSSGGSGNSSSSDGGGTDPIISVSPYATSNGAFMIKNGVNLRVAKKATMEVFNLNGKSVRKMNFSNGSYYISFNDLPKGLYIVRVKYDNHREILRIPVK